MTKRQLKHILNEFFKSDKRTVNAAYNKCDAQVRDLMSKEMLLSPMPNKRGYPNPTPIVLRDSLPGCFMEALLNILQRYVDHDTLEHEISLETRDGLINLLIELKLLGQIAEFCNNDVLGIYFPVKHQIELYWLSIAIHARILNVSIEDLTVVVVAHELAHAYSHAAKDLDDADWKTTEFNAADREIKEGLAQIYAGWVCNKIERSAKLKLRPYQAYQKLLNKQSWPYDVHMTWKPDREVIRLGLIQARRNSIQDYSIFEQIVT